MKFTSELRDATCQWDHTALSATRQRWPPRLHPNRAGWYSIYRPRKDERLSWPSWLVTYRDGLPVHRRSPIQVLTGSDVAQLHWSRPTRYGTTKPNRQPELKCYSYHACTSVIVSGRSGNATVHDPKPNVVMCKPFWHTCKQCLSLFKPLIKDYITGWPLAIHCGIPWQFHDISLAVCGTPAQVKGYSYHACTSVIVSGWGRNATVHDPKPKWNAQSQEWMQICSLQ